MADLTIEIGKTYADRKDRLHTIVEKRNGWFRDGIGRGYGPHGKAPLGMEDWELVRETPAGVKGLGDA